MEESSIKWRNNILRQTVESFGIGDCREMLLSMLHIALQIPLSLTNPCFGLCLYFSALLVYE